MRIRASWRFAVLAVAAAVLLGGAQGLLAAKQARAVFQETTHDFGKVKQGDALTWEFVFTNKGDAPLLIKEVRTSCGCTAALASADKIAPGGEGRIKTTFNSAGYQGRITKYIFLVSNDAASENRELSLIADIEVPPSPRIELDKYNVELGVSLEGEPASAKVVVKNVGERELRLEMAHETIKFSSGGKPLAFPVFIPAGGSLEVELQLPTQVRPGMARDYVLIRSNDTIRSTLSVYISRYVISKQELKALFDKYRSVVRGN
jgi:hypothetical protein